MENKKYIYLGNDLDLPEFRFTKSGVYFGDKIEELKSKYPLLEKILIDVEEFPKTNISQNLIDEITEELRKKGGSN